MRWINLQNRIELVNECWLWRGPINWGGYGVFVYRDKGKLKSMMAHRAVYKVLIGNIPAETLDHQCENRHCVNPMHLIPESLKYNVLRGNSPPSINARKTHCPKGHGYTQIKYQRYCRKCHSETERLKRLAVA